MNKTHHSKKAIDRLALLSVLGDMYAVISVNPSYLSPYKMVEDNPALKGRRTLITQAILQMGIIVRVERGVEGMSGVRYTYQWGRKIGQPSLQMVDDICKVVTLLTSDMVEKRRESRRNPQPRMPRVRPPRTGVTSCVKCCLRDVANCREKLLVLGYNCTKVLVDTIDHEVIMGLKGSH